MHVAAVELRSVRQCDFVARFGGEEFVVLLPDTALPHAQQLAQRIQSQLHECQHPGLPACTISIGIAGQQTSGESLDSLLSRAEENCVVFEVTDTGIGIAPEHQEQVFETFWQVDQTATRKQGGAGLGLSVSRRLARALGGDLSVESALGKGSRFRFWLPR